MEDDPLMQRAQRGDAEAFAALFDRYQKAIFNFMRRLGMSRGAAEEGTQEVFLKLWEHRDQYRPGGPFRVYLYRIARNHRINQLRRGPVNPRRYLEAREDRGEDPAEAAERGDSGARARQALEALPEDFRVPFLLKQMQGLSYAEVSRVTGLTPRQAEDRVAEAFELLSRSLGA